jgi:glyoxylase-like metal-dependent hydrolase (beta-lactamase superfamily II)
VANPDTYVRAAPEGGLEIKCVIDTHVHADHISTGWSLADATSADYVLSEKADVAIPFRGVSDGAEILLGNVTIKVLHTPGHTPEHICLLVTDHRRADDHGSSQRATHS